MTRDELSRRGMVASCGGGLAAMAAGVALTLAVAGCNRSQDAPSVERPPNASRPAMPTETAADDDQVIPPDMKPIPALGAATAVRMSDGDIWEKYADGLVIYEVRPGNGQQPRFGQTVSVNYVGTFPDSNKVFDKSEKGHPFTFRLGTDKIIKGWNLGISTMKVGGKRRLWLPPGLAYGAGGHLPVIPPNMPLKFEIELLSIRGDPLPEPTFKVPEAKPLGPATKPAADKGN